ncbi:hypothetical protein M3J09_010397 [Ascochyta lentis]
MAGASLACQLTPGMNDASRVPALCTPGTHRQATRHEARGTSGSAVFCPPAPHLPRGLALVCALRFAFSYLS